MTADLLLPNFAQWPIEISTLLAEVCVQGRKPSIRAGVSASCELWKASAGIILVLLSMLTWCLSLWICTGCRGSTGVQPGLCPPPAPGAHLTLNLGTLCDWKEGGERAEKSADTKVDFPAHLGQLGHPQLWTFLFTLKTVLQKPCRLKCPLASQLLLCFCVGFQPWTTDSGNDSFFSNMEITITVK